MHKVHGPDLVDLLGYSQGFKPLAIQTLTGFDPKVQPQTLINTIDALVVPFKAFKVTQIQVAKPKAPVAAVIRQPQQPIRYLLVLSALLGVVPVTGLSIDKDRVALPAPPLG
jgi:hypothetical protein